MMDEILTRRNDDIANGLGFARPVVWLWPNHRSVVSKFPCSGNVSSFYHFIVTHLECPIPLKRRLPRSFQYTLKCTDAINLGNDQHCVNMDSFSSPLENSHPKPNGLSPPQVAAILLWRAPKEAPSGLVDQKSSKISFQDYHQASLKYLWWVIGAALILIQRVPTSSRIAEMEATSLSSIRKIMTLWQTSRVESCLLVKYISR